MFNAYNASKIGVNIQISWVALGAPVDGIYFGFPKVYKEPALFVIRADKKLRVRQWMFPTVPDWMAPSSIAMNAFTLLPDTYWPVVVSGMRNNYLAFWEYDSASPTLPGSTVDITCVSHVSRFDDAQLINDATGWYQAGVYTPATFTAARCLVKYTDPYTPTGDPTVPPY
jgi:hypothetical protein